MKLEIFTLLLILQTSVYAQKTDVVTDIFSPPRDIEFIGDEMFISQGLGLMGGLYENNQISKINVNDPLPASLTVVVPDLGWPYGLSSKDNELCYSEIYKIQDDISKINILETNPTPNLVFQNVSVEDSYAILVDGNQLFFSSDKNVQLNMNGDLYMIDLGSPFNAEPTFIGQGAFISDLEAHEGFLYVSENVGNKITRRFLDNPTEVDPNFEIFTNSPFGLAFAGDFLYFSEVEDNRISRINLTSSDLAPEVVATGFSNPLHIEIYNNELYVVESSKISKISLGSLSTENNNLANDLIISPNPTSDFVNVSNLQETVEFTIFNSLGKIVKNGKLSPSNNTILVEDLSKNIYFLKLNNSNDVKKLIIN